MNLSIATIRQNRRQNAKLSLFVTTLLPAQPNLADALNVQRKYEKSMKKVGKLASSVNAH